MNSETSVAKNSDKNIHFGSISMSKAKGLYARGKYSLIMVLLYIDSRKRKTQESQYEYPFEYNAPDIHHNTGVGLKAVNDHLRMLRLRGALELMVAPDGKPLRTSKGALKYRVVKSVYEQKWGPSSRGADELAPGHSETTENATTGKAAGYSEPCANLGTEQEVGHLETSANAPSSPDVGQLAPSANALNSLQVGHSGTSENTPIAGHSAPTNDNERIREEKNGAKKEDGSASASPPLDAPASASASLKVEEGETVTSDKKRIGVSDKDVNRSNKVKAPSSKASDSAPPLADPYDQEYCMYESYVRRYEQHAEALNQYLEQRPDLLHKINSASETQQGRIITGLLDQLNLR